MSRFLPLTTLLIFSTLCIPQLFAQKPSLAPAPKVKTKSKVKPKVRTKKSVKLAPIKKKKTTVRIASGTATIPAQGLTGQWEGKPCHGGTSKTSENVSVECTIGGQSATCNCKASCTNTCVGKTVSAPGTFSTDCTIDVGSCSVQPKGGAGSTGIDAGSKSTL